MHSSQLDHLGAYIEEAQLLTDAIHVDELQDLDEFFEPGDLSPHGAPVLHGVEHQLLQVRPAMVGGLQLGNLGLRKLQLGHEVADLVLVDVVAHDYEGLVQQHLCEKEERKSVKCSLCKHFDLHFVTFVV